MEEHGLCFSNGLSDMEFSLIEQVFGVIFPPDLKIFFSYALPVSDYFINWRMGLNSEDYAHNIAEAINLPLEGILFDVKYNSFWDAAWGKKPETYHDQREHILKEFVHYPQLIPVYSHRYIPSLPLEEDNPIFSVSQTDIIYYGINFADYFNREFNLSMPWKFVVKPKRIDFWSRYAEGEV